MSGRLAIGIGPDGAGVEHAAVMMTTAMMNRRIGIVDSVGQVR
jgi:hypothetical protein